MTFRTRTYPIKNHKWRPDKAHSCIPRFEVRATPRHELGNRAPCTPASTRQHPLTLATAPGSPAVPYSQYTHGHETKEEKKKRPPRVPREREKTKTRWKAPGSNEGGRFRSGSSERPGMYQPSTLRNGYLSK